ncbi:aminotransferase class I/II-fold pyridoxal phosphate-dependent enzyme [Paenibacillus sp. YYML68]|uniref:aminotransferase class I/II-fold pyridoxal phosphate-dependent enzyme n=1 Tax=Paenibacillus sp. YYML68 TaxID=2909250 RepID=UPI002491F755|nr:aminotransferase class I/II-fold pyridoxal phosphate-dependent enzyme [Paenibacillus sp. YYML68]
MAEKPNIPLLQALERYAETEAVRLHVPGHKGRGEAYGYASSHYEAIVRLDATELPGLDDLHHPEEIIAEAQELAAQCFGAEVTYFLINGSTVGNQAMIMAVCVPGDVLLVQRDAHKSVIHGLMLAGVRAVFLRPELDPISGLSLGIDHDVVEEALKRYPEAKGLLVTRPSYYGVSQALESIASLLHAQDKVLLVDEAHGAHYGFHPALPKSALAAGADAVVQSTHKMLPAMTMCSMLHVQGSRINRQALQKALGMLQSSSPSYPLLASLDISRHFIQHHGTKAIEDTLQVVQELKQQLQTSTRWRCRALSATPRGERHGRLLDPLKLALYDETGALDGFALKRKLEAEGCYAELADPQHVLLAFSPSSTGEDATRLMEALKRIEAEEQHIAMALRVEAGVSTIAAEEDRTDSAAAEKDCTASSTRVPLYACAAEGAERMSAEPVQLHWSSLLHADDSNQRYMPLEASIGERSTVMLVPYPPGIPVLYPGERITRSTVHYVMRLLDSGAKLQGYQMDEARMIPVWCEDIR